MRHTCFRRNTNVSEEMLMFQKKCACFRRNVHVSEEIVSENGQMFLKHLNVSEECPPAILMV
jgi:hypothetical protein